MLKQPKTQLILSNPESGTTLLEVLIGIAMLSLVVVAFLSGLTTSLQGTILADEQTVAESLGRTQLEAIKNSVYNDIPPYHYNKIANVPPGYDININVSPIDPETGTVNFTDTGLQRITITISRGNKQVLVVETFKRK